MEFPTVVYLTATTLPRIHHHIHRMMSLYVPLALPQHFPRDEYSFAAPIVFPTTLADLERAAAWACRTASRVWGTAEVSGDWSKVDATCVALAVGDRTLQM